MTMEEGAPMAMTVGAPQARVKVAKLEAVAEEPTCTTVAQEGSISNGEKQRSKRR